MCYTSQKNLDSGLKFFGASEDKETRHMGDINILDEKDAMLDRVNSDFCIR